MLMADSEYRMGDGTPPAQRSPRVYEYGGEWFFRTREGKAMGPYPNRFSAEQGLADFIQFIQLAPLETLATLTNSLSDDEDSTGGGAPA